MIEKIDTSREAVRKTGKAFLIAGTVIAAILFWKHGLEGVSWRWFLAGGIALYGLGALAYPVMKPIHIGWMKFAQILGWFSTHVVLSVFFYVILTPAGLLMRAFGKDLLDKRFDRSSKSYWRKRERGVFDPKRMENQF